MSNQEIHIHTHTDTDGIVHLDIPVGIVNKDIDIAISYSIEETEVDTELAEILAQAKPASDLSEFSGVLELTEDPLEYQRRIRDEW